MSAVGNGFVSPSGGFPALCAGDAVSPQAVSRLPLNQRMVAVCPGFSRPRLVTGLGDTRSFWLGNPKVTLAAEQGRQTPGIYSSFSNGEVRDWMKNPDYAKTEGPKSMCSSLPHPLVPCRCLREEDEPVYQ